MSNIRRATVVVLGAGLTGSGVALDLAARGVDVLVIEQDERPMNRASLRNEGKIHLGLLYANDRTLQTAQLQLRGALRFRSLLQRWLGAGVDALRISRPFHYLVAKDSVMSPDELETHYGHVQALYDAAMGEDHTPDYLGTRPARLSRRLDRSAWSQYFMPDHFSAVFETPELAIDPADLSEQVNLALERHPRITVWTAHTVEEVQPAGDMIDVVGRSGEDRWKIQAEQVVNALSENRLRFDRQFGLPLVPGWLYRLKYRVIVRLPEALRQAPSATMVIGRYGDVVIRPDGTAYLSWYPVGLRGWTPALHPPAEWNGPCRGEVDDETRTLLVEQTIGRLAEWFPGLRDSEPLLVDAGAIVAYGNTDVDDRASGLHDRSRIGVTSAGGYHSVEPGKLTTAPLFAERAAERVAEALGV